LTDLAVVIGNWEGAEVLDDCLASLAGQSLSPSEVLVVDASSADGSAALAHSHGARVLIRPNRGLGFLYNEGARASRATYVLCANNDVAFERSCLELLAAALDEDPYRFAADPTQLDWSGNRVVHARATLRRGPLLRQPLPGFRLDLAAPSAEVAPTLSANGGAMLVRRERLLELGGFDETMFMDFEDLDLCWRAWLRAWPSIYVPDAVVRHRVGAVTGKHELRRRIRSSHHNLLRFALKCLPAREALRVLAGEMLRLPRHPGLVGPALARVARELPAIARERRAARPSPDFTRWVLDGMPEPSRKTGIR
jgi:N-acetylglucosaminyl-diphospho-decaprenol L-rhamnosyltransferase